MTSVRHEAMQAALKLVAAYPEHAPLLHQIHSNHGNIFSRNTLAGHVTVSACLFDHKLTSVLMIDARKFGKRLLPGGHIDFDEAPAQAAARELAEECGVESSLLELLSPQPVSMNVHWIEASLELDEERHLHFDVHILFRCVKETLKVSVDNREARDAGWFKTEELAISYPELFRYISRSRLNG